jgi:hypothetical protein
MNAPRRDAVQLRNRFDAVAFKPAVEPVVMDLIPDIAVTKPTATSGLLYSEDALHDQNINP